MTLVYFIPSMMVDGYKITITIPLIVEFSIDLAQCQLLPLLVLTYHRVNSAVVSLQDNNITIIINNNK